MKKSLQTILTISFVVVFVGVGGYLLAAKADAATPNDPLFPLDKLMESATRLVITNPQSKITFEEQVLLERITELESESANGEDVEASLSEIETQEDNLGEALEDEDSNTSTSMLERYQQQVAEHLQIMEEVKSQVGNETAQASIQKVIEKIQTKSQERIQKIQNAHNEKTNNGKNN